MAGIADPCGGAIVTGAGIDYGLGQTNIDHASGIRYGVISPHSLSGDALSEIYDHGDNLTYARAVEEAHADIGAALTRVLDDLGVLPWKDADKSAYVAEVAGAVWDHIEQDWNDRYEGDGDEHYRYEREGYIIETSSLGLYVIASPYFTLAPFCSPCAPGAGDLDTARDSGVKTYCLGADWFKDDRAPYPVFRVEDGSEVAHERAI